MSERLALRELEAAACLGAAVLLALDDAWVAGQEPGLFDRGAERRLVTRERLGNAMLHCAGLTRKAPTDYGRYDVILVTTISDIEGLVDDQSKRRTREIDFLLPPVDDDLARARLQPDARDRILAAAGRIGTTVLVELLLAERSGL